MQRPDTTAATTQGDKDVRVNATYLYKESNHCKGLINVQETFFGSSPALSPFARTLVQEEEYYFLTFQHQFLKHTEYWLWLPSGWQDLTALYERSMCCSGCLRRQRSLMGVLAEQLPCAGMTPPPSLKPKCSLLASPKLKESKIEQSAKPSLQGLMMLLLAVKLLNVFFAVGQILL